jgi:hypothetical protein
MDPGRGEAQEPARVRELPNEPKPCVSDHTRLTDLVAAWRDANPGRNARLAASVAVEIQVDNAGMTAVRPPPAWAPYFEELLVHHGAEDKSWTLRGVRLIKATHRKAGGDRTPACGSLRGSMSLPLGP